MSLPRLLLAPTHRTGLANGLAAAVAEIATAQGQRVRYHHIGPLSPAAAWDRWEGAAFLDPSLYPEDNLRELYDVATRGAHLSIVSTGRGVLDCQDGAEWRPAEVAAALDCPIVTLMDCRGWGATIKALVAGLRRELRDLNLAGVILTGVADREHRELLRNGLREEDVPVVGCLFDGDGPAWDSMPPGAWGLPLDLDLLEAVGRQVDVAGLVSIAGQRGYLPAYSRLADRGSGGPLIAVAAGKGFTPWSRDSIEVLRSAGARIRRLDLLDDAQLPDDIAGLVLAGTIWPSELSSMALNRPLLDDIRGRISGGLPTIAMGGGMLLLLSRLQDTLGRTVDLADVLPAQGEILWDLEDAVYVNVTAEQPSLLLDVGETAKAWLVTEAEVLSPTEGWRPALSITGHSFDGAHGEGLATDSLFCTRVFVHLAALPGMADRFVRRCAAYSGRAS